MALKGSIAKQEVLQKILDTFEGAFIDNKDIRIPFLENGEIVQIKCTLTCAKVNIEPGSDNAIPGVKIDSKKNAINFEDNGSIKEDLIPSTAIPTEEEKQNISLLISKLGL